MTEFDYHAASLDLVHDSGWIIKNTLTSPKALMGSWWLMLDQATTYRALLKSVGDRKVEYDQAENLIRRYRILIYDALVVLGEIFSYANLEKSESKNIEYLESKFKDLNERVRKLRDEDRALTQVIAKVNESKNQEEK